MRPLPGCTDGWGRSGMWQFARPPFLARSVVMTLAVVLSGVPPAFASVPRAECRPGDRIETGLQGETTRAEIASGASRLGFNCNADLVGQYQGEGASWQIAAWKSCAYFDQRLNPAESHPGVAVVDVSDPARPAAAGWLNDVAMLDPWQSLKVNAARGLLGGAQRSGPGFAIYDISQDCAHPAPKALINVPGMFGRTGQWAPDGNTYYATPLRADQSLVVLDASDVTQPRLIPCAAGSFGCLSNGFFLAPPPLSPRFDDLEFSKDGNIAYVAVLGTGSTAAANGLVILDVSDFQSRKV